MDTKNRLFRSASVVALMTLLSRITGFVRDLVTAMMFGAGSEFDAFVVAFKIPNFMRRLFGEGAFSQAFVPIMSELKTRASDESVREFVARVAGSLSLILLLVVAVTEMIAPLIISVVAPGFLRDPLRYQHAVSLLRMLLPYLWLISMTAFSAGVLNTCRRFAIPALTPAMLNIAITVTALWLAPHFAEPIYVLGVGVLVGGVLQLSLQLPLMARLGFLVWPRLGFYDANVKRVMKLMVPALFGVSVAQISLLIDNFFASFLPQGSISWLYYSDRLTYLPLGVIGVALATVVLPALSQQHAQKSAREYSATLDWALKVALLIGLPAALGLYLLAGPILSTLINYGRFTDTDVLMTRQSLQAFAFGLPAFMSVKVLASGFYSRQNIKTPVKIAAVAVLVNVGLILLLIHPLRHAGLALATSLASWFNCFMLMVLLLRTKIYTPSDEWKDFLLAISLALLAMVAVISYGHGDMQQWFAWHVLARVSHLAIIILAALIVYFSVLALLGIRFRDIRSPRLAE